MDSLRWDYSLYLVTDRSYIGKRKLTECVEQAICGGVSMVQLREKTASSRDFYDLAMELKEIISGYKVPFIINDRLDIALAVNADGLHLGQDDLSIGVAREYFGQDKVIGISVRNVQEAIQAEKEGADYLGAGAMFATGTKTDANIITLEELRRIKEAVSIPVVAIGGIKKENAGSIMSTGIEGVSVVSAILAEENIKMAAQVLRRIVDRKSEIIG